MKKGVCKWFNENKGFGFISQADGPDVFVHYSVIQMEGYKKLIDGEEVEYEASDSPKGLQATTVVRYNHR